MALSVYADGFGSFAGTQYYATLYLYDWSTKAGSGAYAAYGTTALNAMSTNGKVFVSPSSSAQSGSLVSNNWQVYQYNYLGFIHVYVATSAGASPSYSNCMRYYTPPDYPTVTNWFTSGTTAYFYYSYSIGSGAASLGISSGTSAPNYQTYPFKQYVTSSSSSGDYFTTSRTSAGDCYGYLGVTNSIAGGGSAGTTYNVGTSSTGDVGCRNCSYAYNYQYVTDQTTKYLYYNANGGTGAPSTQSYTSSGSYTFTISSTRPTRDGYTFLGWSTSSDASSASYQPGGTISVSSSTTLYAVWQDDRSTLTVSGGTGVTVSPSGTTYFTGTTSTTITATVAANYGLATPTISGSVTSKITASKNSNGQNVLTVVITPTTSSKISVSVSFTRTNPLTANLKYYLDEENYKAGKTLTTSSTTVGSSYSLPNMTGTKPKSTFLGWKQDGSSTLYQPAKSFTVADTWPDTYGQTSIDIAWYGDWESYIYTYLMDMDARSEAPMWAKVKGVWKEVQKAYYTHPNWPKGKALYYLKKRPPVKVEGVSINQTVKRWLVSDTPYTLTATIIPDEATNKKVTWSVNNGNVQLVSSNGLEATFKAVSLGSSRITVTTEDGFFTDSVEIETYEPTDLTKTMSYDSSTAYVPGGANVVLGEVQDSTIASWANQFMLDNPSYTYVADGVPMSWFVNGKNIYDMYDNGYYNIPDALKGSQMPNGNIWCVPYGGTKFRLFNSSSNQSIGSMTCIETDDGDVKNPQAFILYVE